MSRIGWIKHYKPEVLPARIIFKELIGERAIMIAGQT
jgi:hypothetical protein